MNQKNIEKGVSTIETNWLSSELNERIEFINNEYHRLKAESVIESNPIAKYRIEKNMKEALREIENTKKLLQDTQQPPIGGGSQEKKTALVDTIPNSTTEPSYNKPPYDVKGKNSTNLLQRPIGYIGITAFAGVLTIFVVYLIKKHFGIPL